LVKIIPLQLKKNYNMMVTLIVSYMAVFIIPLIIGSIIYSMTQKAVLNEVHKTKTNMLRHSAATIDTEIMGMRQMGMIIATNPTVMQFLRVTKPFTEDEWYQITRVISNLSPFLKTNYGMKNDINFFIYYNKSDVIITPNTIYMPDFFYNTTFSYPGVPYNQWHDNIQNYFKEKCFTSNKVLIENDPMNIITYVQPIPLTYSGKPSALIVMCLNEDNLIKIMGDVAQGGVGLVLDDKGRVIFRTSTQHGLSYLNLNALVGEEGVLNKIINRENMMVSWVTSKNSGFKYVTIIPEAVFMSNARKIQLVTVFLATFCIITGIILCVTLAWHNYSPIKKILEILAPYAKPDRNEMDYIRSMIIEALRKNQQLEKQVMEVLSENDEIKSYLQKNDNVVCNNLLLQLLRSSDKNVDGIRSWLSIYNVKLIYRRFTVINMQIDSPSSAGEQDTGCEWIRFTIASATVEMTRSFGWSHTVIVDDKKMSLIINFYDSYSDSNLRMSISRLVVQLKEFMKKQFDIILTIGISCIHTGIDSLHNSFEEAEKALAYKIVRGYDTIIFFDEIMDTKSDYFYPIDMELRLINSVKYGDFRQCNLILNEVYEENIHRRKLSLRLMQCLFFSIMSTALKTLDEIRIKYTDVFDDMLNPVDRLLESETIDEIYTNVQALFKTICDHINQLSVNRNTHLKKKLLEYICVHFTEASLSQTSVAGAMGISSQYLSRYFKQEMGINMMAYIHKLRINYSKELLSSTNMIISEISQKVGYGSEKTFIRIFKHFEGITPSRFKCLSMIEQSGAMRAPCDIV